MDPSHSACTFRETWCSSRSWPHWSGHLNLAVKPSSHGSASQAVRKKRHPGLDNKKCARLSSTLPTPSSLEWSCARHHHRHGSTPDSGHPTCWQWHVATQPPTDHKRASQIAASWTCVASCHTAWCCNSTLIAPTLHMRSSSFHKELQCSRPSNLFIHRTVDFAESSESSASSHTSREALVILRAAQGACNVEPNTKHLNSMPKSSSVSTSETHGAPTGRRSRILTSGRQLIWMASDDRTS